MSDYTIYHNPRCTKSRQTLALLNENGIEPEIIKYLEDTPTKAEFEKVLAKLDLKPSDLLRKGERMYKEKFKSMNFTEDEWLTIMLENPKLIERPIVTKGNTGVIGRPPENVLDLI